MTPDQYFFYNHAGYSMKPGESKANAKRRMARQLARAESVARNEGYEFHWEPDRHGCIGCDCGSSACPCSTGEPHEVLTCVMTDYNGKIVASLGSICEPTREYMRVIQAELAREGIR